MADDSKLSDMESSEDEDETTDPLPKQPQGKRPHPGDDDDDIPCPEGVPKQLRELWPSLSREKRLQLLDHVMHHDVGTVYRSRCLHKDLFDPSQWRRWIHPALLAAIEPWRQGGSMDLDALEGFKVEAPGIFSFPALNDEFCRTILEEVAHYREQGMPGRAPNSMNNYGLVLNEVGLRPLFDAILREALRPLGAALFGDAPDRVAQVGGAAVTGTENWGGSSLDEHHTFVVQYRPQDDKHLDMHIDECDVTFNFGITDSHRFQGNDLTFCGMFDSEDHRRYLHTYKHVKGRCVVHSGKRRHGALDIVSGERASLIMWTKSRSFRATREYERRNRGLARHGPVDRVCLSYTHDPDYKALMPKKMQYRMVGREEGEEVAAAAARAPAATHRAWLRVCAEGDLPEGGNKMVELKRENEQVVVFRHRGELFAIDNRCAHMGGPLCEGDVEDLGLHISATRGEAKKEDGVVRCPRHGMCFNIRTGENIRGGHMKQKVYPVRVTDELDVEVEVDLETDTP